MPMFCPNCGTQPQLADQKFCKSCGTNLHLVSQALSVPQAGVPNPNPAFQSFQSPPPVPSPPPMNLQTVQPVPLSAIPSLPFMEQELHRQKLRRLGWAMALGGPLMVPTLAIMAGVFFDHPEICVVGIPVFLAGLFILLYTKIALRQAELPQVIVVQQTPVSPPVAQQPPAAVPQLPAPDLYSVYVPGSVTEHTTRQLQVPSVPKSRDTH